MWQTKPTQFSLPNDNHGNILLKKATFAFSNSCLTNVFRTCCKSLFMQLNLYFFTISSRGLFWSRSFAYLIKGMKVQTLGSQLNDRLLSEVGDQIKDHLFFLDYCWHTFLRLPASHIVSSFYINCSPSPFL